jgi:hypothetical protein
MTLIMGEIPALQGHYHDPKFEKKMQGAGGEQVMFP